MVSIDSQHIRVWEYFKEHIDQPLKLTDISKDLTIKIGNIRTAVTRLKSKGIVKVGPGYYRLPKELNLNNQQNNWDGVHALHVYKEIDVSKMEGNPPLPISNLPEFVTKHYMPDITKDYINITRYFKEEGNVSDSTGWKCVWTYPVKDKGTIELQFSANGAIEFRLTHIENDKGFTAHALLASFMFVDMIFDKINIQNWEQWQCLQIDFVRDKKHKIFAINAITQEVYKGVMIKLYNKGDDARSEVRVTKPNIITAAEIKAYLDGNVLGFQEQMSDFGNKSEIFMKSHLRQHKLDERKRDELLTAAHDLTKVVGALKESLNRNPGGGSP